METERGPILQDKVITELLHRRHIKNILALSISFTLLFTAYFGLCTLQSSLNLNQGLGVITQAVLYGVAILSNLLLPNLMINRLGHKWTLVISALCYLLWIAANGHATWTTLLPASILLGAASSPLWAAQNSYLALTADQSATLTQEDKACVIARFSGIFFFFLQLGVILKKKCQFDNFVSLVAP